MLKYQILTLTQGFSAYILSFTLWLISKVKVAAQIFFIFSFLQMPIVIGKSVKFLLTKFTHKTGQIYFQEVNLPPVKNPCFNTIVICRNAVYLSYSLFYVNVQPASL